MTRLRLSQVLIFPQHQKKGYGSFLYNTIYQWALQNDKIQDITVEDPNEDFTTLRDLCDLQIVTRNPFFQQLNVPFNDEHATILQRELKLSKVSH